MQVQSLADIEGLMDAELENALVIRFATASATTWVEHLNAAGVGAHVLMDFEEVMEAKSVKERGLSIIREHPSVGPIRLVGPSRRLSLTPLQATFTAGPPGFDTQSVVSELDSPEPFDVLVEKGVIAERLPEGVSFVGQFR